MKPLILAVAALLALPARASATILFREDFNGAAGAFPNPAVWRSLNCNGFVAGADCAASRATLNGVGQLKLEVTPNRGAFIGTFAYGTGWPPTGSISAAWSVPFTVTTRLKMPTTIGVWTGIWMINVDRSVDSGLWELDMAEVRSSLPTLGSCYHHYVTRAGDTQQGGKADIGGPGDWHTYKMIATADRTLYTVDGRTCLSVGPVAGRFGLLVTSLAGRAGTWQTNKGPAMTSGSARSWVDYIEVSR